MRALLNNPKFVGGLLLLCALIAGYRWLQQNRPSRPAEPTRTSAYTPRSAKPPSPEWAELEELLAINRGNWSHARFADLPRRIRDPFSKRAEPPPAPAPPKPEAPPVVEEEPVDTAKLIAEALGLDEKGFFIRYKGQRLREGDHIGREAIGRLAVSGRSKDNSPAHLARIRSIVDGLRADGEMVVDGELWVVLNGRPYRCGDLVEKSPFLALLSIAPDQLQFIDDLGNAYAIRRP